MNSLYEIIENIKNGEKPDYEDLYWAVLALNSLLHFEKESIRSLAEGKILGKKMFFTYDPEYQERESFNRRKKAFAKSPKEWVGWNNDPSNPDYQESRKMFLKMAEVFMKRFEKEQQSTPQGKVEK
jgi:hypothetical protein